jgi:hypothetical protein
MVLDEWERLVLRLNANYPGQQVEPPTAAEWFGPLANFPAGEVWDAIDRHRRDLTPDRDGRPAGHWAPSLAGILAAIDANWRERSAARRELERRQARAERNGRGGVVMPPETREALRLLERSKLVPDHPDHLDAATARERIEALAGQLEERVGR